MIENDSIYFGELLVARMSLYKQHFIWRRTYLELYKLEDLPQFQNKKQLQPAVFYFSTFSNTFRSRRR